MGIRKNIIIIYNYNQFQTIVHCTIGPSVNNLIRRRRHEVPFHSALSCLNQCNLEQKGVSQIQIYKDNNEFVIHSMNKRHMYASCTSL